MSTRVMKGCLVLVAGLAVAASSFALSYVLGADESLWSDTGAWVDTVGAPMNAVPGAADSVYIREGYSVTVNSDVGTITKMYVGDTAALGSSGIVNITGGKLATSVASEVGRAVDGAYGELNISGGVFQSGDAQGSDLPPCVDPVSKLGFGRSQLSDPPAIGRYWKF